MPATLDDVVTAVRDLISETRTSRVIFEAHRSGPVAPSWELDDPKYGDPKAGFDPYTWKKMHRPSCKELTYSQCPAEFLDHLAFALTNMAQDERQKGTTTEKGVPVCTYTFAKAAKARGWALRIRLGYVPPVPAASAGAPRPGGMFAKSPPAATTAAPEPEPAPPAQAALPLDPGLGDSLPDVEDGPPVTDDDFGFGELAPERRAAKALAEADDLEPI